ncbi:hypothetical protein [Marisediminicola sp. LYQ85]|uniref:hypothetical protein n=1 Tax=Marisediminicola sp. LYQ85 TaxID=3391062 RepID=UPI003982F8C4
MLWDQPVPQEVLRWFALNGTPVEVHQVACREGLPDGVARILATQGSADTRTDLAINDALSQEVVSVLYQGADDDQARELISRHPNAPVELLVTVPFGHVTGLALHNFLRKVAATEAEEQELRRAGSSIRGQRATLGDLWSQVRRSEHE